MAKFDTRKTGKAEKASTEKTTIKRDGETGRFILPKGYGSMRGKLKISPGIDLGKPIAEQVARRKG